MTKEQFDSLSIIQRAEIVREKAEEIKKNNKNIDDIDAFNEAKKEIIIN